MCASNGMAQDNSFAQWNDAIQSIVIQLQQFLASQQDVVTLLLVLLLGCLAGGILYPLVVINLKNHRVKRTFQSGRIAETAAVNYLRTRGYKIIASQLREEVSIYIDGEEEKSIVRADYLVRRGWKYYVVEVKSGRQGNAKLPAIRRQLLEYYLVYQPDGVLLLDMEHKNLQEIRFAYTDGKAVRRR